MFVLPLACFCLMVLLTCRPGWPARVSLSGALLLAGVYCATFAWAIDLALSVQQNLTAGWIALAWGLVACALAITAWVQRQRWLKNGRPARLVRRCRFRLAHLDTTGRLALAIILTVLALTLLVGLWSLPNNHDAMTYHLPRIMHWIQNRQIGPYLTSMPAQIYQHPGAEYLQLQVYLLTGSDAAMHLVQWLALVGCILAAGLIAKELQGRASAVWLAMVLAATLPMAIFQSTSCKNDLLLAFFALTAIWLILRLRDGPRGRGPGRDRGRGRGLWLEIALMLACGWVLLIKGTGYVYLPVLILAMAWACWYHRGWLRAMTLTFCTGLVCLGMIGSQWVSSWIVFESIFGPEAQHFRPHGNLAAAVVVDTLRNLGSELSTPVQAVNNLMIGSFAGLLSPLGLNLHDARSLNHSSTYFLDASQLLSEDHAGAPLLMTLILIAVVVVLYRGTRRTRAYLALWLLACLLFAGLVSWNEWITRLLLPAMLAATPLAAVSLGFDRWPRPGKRAILWLCLVMATPALLFNYSRSILGPYSIFTQSRTQAQFISSPIVQRDFNQIITQLQQRNARDLGLDLGSGVMEYPFWQRMGGPAHVHILHVKSQLEPRSDPASQQGFHRFPRWLIIYADKATPPRATTTRYIEQVRYDRVWRGDLYALFERQDTQPH